MYKIILYDTLDNILDSEFYLTMPTENQVHNALITSMRRFKVEVRARIEVVKYIDLGKVS
jgi:hypothetical protein